jgi:hypothetical protein
MFAENPDLAWEGDEPTVCRLIRAWEPVNTCHWPNVRLRCVQTAMPALPAPKPPASLARAGRAPLQQNKPWDLLLHAAE